MTKKLTRKQKIKMNPHGSGNSKYAQKIARRAKIAKKAGLPANTPYPVLRKHGVGIGNSHLQN